MSRIQSIGVIGAGQMGAGIAQVFAQAGYAVALVDEAAGAQALERIAADLGKSASRGDGAASDVDAVIARIRLADAVEALEPCDLVIESVTESHALKAEILERVSAVLKPHALIASNTSSLSITGLAAATDRPDRFLGLHFMNPAPRMRLVEIIRGIATSKETFEQARALIEDLGKTVAISEDFPGFIVNRVLMPMINEAIYTIYEGVGTVESVDTALSLGANHPMGPLALADFIGLDTCLAIMNALYEGLADTKYRPCPLLVKYVEAGWLGRKTGRGFYDYSGECATPTR